MLKNQLNKLIKQTTLSINDAQIDKLIHYVTLLDKWNKAYNLTSVRDPNEMLVKHILDSIVVSPYLEGQQFIDDLVDSLGKRVRFLKQVQFELNLNNINPVQSRIEMYNHKQFDGVISRAFASLNDMLQWCQHLPNETGLFYALKSQSSEDEIAKLHAPFKLKTCINLNVPQLNAERKLLIIQASTY